VNPQNVHIIDQEPEERRIFVYLPDAATQRKVLESFLQCNTKIHVQPYTLSSAPYQKPDAATLPPAATPPHPEKRKCAGEKDTRSQQRVCPWNSVKFYTLGQRIGNETRQMEFKGGQGHIESNLTEVVCKYMSGFLNSNGGTLIFGVNDAGITHIIEGRNTESYLQCLKPTKPVLELSGLCGGFPPYYTIVVPGTITALYVCYPPLKSRIGIEKNIVKQCLPPQLFC